jgi:hypothetical protein
LLGDSKWDAQVLWSGDDAPDVVRGAFAAAAVADVVFGRARDEKAAEGIFQRVWLVGESREIVESEWRRIVLRYIVRMRAITARDRLAEVEVEECVELLVPEIATTTTQLV